jgi:predicted nucleic acid-binding protein
MKRYVLDTLSVIAYLEGEETGKGVIPILESALENKAEIYMCVVNWGEVYYIALREGGKERAEIYRELIAKYPVKIIDADIELTLMAAKYKAHYKMSYADAFAAALAQEKNAFLVTGDKEFKHIEGKIKLLFLTK